MKNFFVFIVLAIVGIASFTACSKDDDNDTLMIASITMLSSEDTSVMSFTYDEQNRISKFIDDDFSTVFQYKNDQIVEKWISVRYPSDSYEITYELKNGKTVAASGNGVDMEFEYSGNQLVKFMTEDEDGRDTTLFTWEGGNVVKESMGQDEFVFTATELDNNFNMDLNAFLNGFEVKAVVLNILGAKSNKIMLEQEWTLSEVKKDENGRLISFNMKGESAVVFTYVLTYK